MRKLVLSLIGASALAISSVASAVVIVPGDPLNPGSDPTTSFLVSPANAGDPAYHGTITAQIGHSGIQLGAFQDIFRFTIPQTGVGSGSITTSVSYADFLSTTDLDITSVVVNGLTAFEVLSTANNDPTNPIPFVGNPCLVENAPGTTCGANEAFFRNDVPITAGIQNEIVVTGSSRGNGAYGGQLTFTPAAVPEPATWAMMLLGFAGIGWQIRRKRSGAALAQIA